MPLSFPSHGTRLSMTITPMHCAAMT
jgi:hypothetical protein